MSEDNGRETGQGPADRLSSEKTVGEIMLASRERKGASLEEASEETRIAVKNLEYLETDNFEALPAKVYVRGFLRTYASYLGLDAEHLLNKYEVQSGQTHTSRGDMWEIEAEVVEERLGSQNIMKRLALAAIVVLLLLVVVLLFLRMRGGGGEGSVDRAAGGETTETAAVEVAAPVREAFEVPREEPAETGREEPAETALSPMKLQLTANPTDTTWFELVTISTVEQRPETTSYN
ncbi:MAG TPA: helix-turn-helix domain-containing protein, partial [Candidatus Eisenbacteria bacterium]|nr:helix-turn-helix domain-containing protein [Candidatus Eisenbacteria bacterium]